MLTYPHLGLERNSIPELVDYLVQELDEAGSSLDGVSFDGRNAGRMSTPYAMAIKEKVLLFAASPLYNGNTDFSALRNSSGEPLVPQNNDIQKWKLAADAAKAIIDKYVPNTFSLFKVFNDDGSLNPYLSTRQVMLEDYNEEIIYARPLGANTYHYDVTPYHLGAAAEIRGGGALGATQEAVDAFFTANGRSIDDPQSGYIEEGFSNFQAPFDITARSTFNQWVDREPRFYTGITYNNSLWLVRDFGDIVTETWFKGNSGRQAGTNDYSATGYVVRKNVSLQDWRINLREVFL